MCRPCHLAALAWLLCDVLTATVPAIAQPTTPPPKPERIAPADLQPTDGAPSIPDLATFGQLAFKSDEAVFQSPLAGLEFVKFCLFDAHSDRPQLYFINTQTHRLHETFCEFAGLPFGPGDNPIKGLISYHPLLKSPSGQPGLYTFEFEPQDEFPLELVRRTHELLVAKMPPLAGNVGYYPQDRGIVLYQREKARYDAGPFPVYLDEHLGSANVAYLPLNVAESFGLLRVLSPGQQPRPQDVVILRSLPNDLSRVAGVISEVRQTPLSHVNLRAVQDGVPNAFIVRAAEHPSIKPLIGRQVRFTVTADGFKIREASLAEVDAHFAALRPSTTQSPGRDLSVRKIRPLAQIGFQDAASVGVKAANVATLRTFDLPAGTVPDGAAIPFYFYDQFMRHNGFYDQVRSLLARTDFQSQREVQQQELLKLQAQIEQAAMPAWMMTALAELHGSFPEGTSLRCRSSTNNEDLAGFSGAGLYDSFTHKPSEGHLAKTIKQVYASMWNFRAFEEREFYRVDHFSVAMGVLVHPNYKGELANGVAVTRDILYHSPGTFYVNTQAGENLVTNPNEQSAAEELLVSRKAADGHRTIRHAILAPGTGSLLTDAQIALLRSSLELIHTRFAPHYGRAADDERFALEIEFKISKEGALVIKQVRPWVFAASASPPKGATSPSPGNRSAPP